MPIEVLSECLNCGKVETKYNTQGKYCNAKCQHAYQNQIKLNEWLSGGRTWSGALPNWVRKYISERDNDCCTVCGINEYMGKPISLEVDHEDGNPHNHSSDNLRTICPNCHSQTDSYRNKNYGNGRTLRSPVS
jgi:5-methylcytosine-specific restriction endonuclease McrA